MYHHLVILCWLQYEYVLVECLFNTSSHLGYQLLSDRIKQIDLEYL